MKDTDSIFKGFAPEVAVQPGNPETLKYGKIWEFSEYRKIAPGEELAQVFLAQARPRAGASVIDFGCGTGRGALMLALLGRMKVTMIDFVNNSLDPDVREALTTQAHALRFVKADLEKPIPVAAEYGYCTDVMEHIPPDKVDQVLNAILHAARHVFFSISTIEDACGALIGEPLHLSIHPYAWWVEKFNQRDCIIHWSYEADGVCLFYVTAWQDAQAVVDIGVLNITEEQIRTNVRHNIAGGWTQVSPHEKNEIEVMILGGGPSLTDFETDIRQKLAEGVKLVTLNGAYNWAVARGLVPLNQIVVDARPFNARFTKPVVEGCKYFIASQCDPLVLDGLPPEQTYLWHTTTEMIRDMLLEQYPLWWGVPGGSTVLLRAIPLLRMLGFYKFHLYGCDSCLGPGDIHHAYAQPENNSEAVISMVLSANGTLAPAALNIPGEIFSCYAWMVSQAQEMMSLIKFLGDEIQLEIYGEGLLAHILRMGATVAEEAEE